MASRSDVRKREMSSQPGSVVSPEPDLEVGRERGPESRRLKERSRFHSGLAATASASKPKRSTPGARPPPRGKVEGVAGLVLERDRVVAAVATGDDGAGGAEIDAEAHGVASVLRASARQEGRGEC